MKLLPASLLGVRRAFGLPPLEPAAVARRVSNHGHLAEEAFAYLILREHVLDAEPALLARIEAIAAACHASPQTLRAAEGDRTAVRETLRTTASALDEIIALDAPLHDAETAHAAALAMRTPDGTPPRGSIGALMDSMAPALRP
ncbi:MAG: hypothetical protein AAFP17_19335 [Pseudomonadota bacterium]